MGFKDHFSSKAAIYAKARPRYPAAFFAELAQLVRGHSLAWDCGSGNGQAAVSLAEHFDRIVATEPSAAQLAEAIAHPKVTYVQSAELAPGVADGSVDMVTVACAAHWFDLAVFYPEVRRVVRPGGLLAVWNYDPCTVSPAIDQVIQRFYHDKVGAYWPPERKQAGTGYRLLEFPFPEIPFPSFNLEVTWTVEEFVAYLHTWSAVTRYKQATGIDPVEAFLPELQAVWGAGRHKLSWPMGGRLGRL